MYEWYAPPLAKNVAPTKSNLEDNGMCIYIYIYMYIYREREIVR